MRTEPASPSLVRAAMRAPYLARDEEFDLAVRWKDKHDQSRKTTELRVENAYFADSKKETSGTAAQDYTPGGSAFSELEDDDGELPF